MIIFILYMVQEVLAEIRIGCKNKGSLKRVT